MQWDPIGVDWYGQSVRLILSSDNLLVGVVADLQVWFRRNPVVNPE
jgi:hypothetical protein